MVSKSLILCEGGQDVGFLNKFCKYLEMDISTVVIQKISTEVEHQSAKSAFFKEETYSTIKQKVATKQYQKVLFIVDADYSQNDTKYGGYDNSENALKNIISLLGFDEKAKYYIMCDPVEKTGNLEHLILSTIDNRKKECIHTLLDCVLDMQTHSNKKIVLSSYETIFKESPYNLTHPNFENLKNLLLWLK
jgi:hypothetical protein